MTDAPMFSVSARFNPPPNWPPPPRGWVPPPGWTPDPSWPSPPEGWQFWVQDPVGVGVAPSSLEARTVSTAPPGWYPDNYSPAYVRWWDGLAWTEYAQPAQVAGPSFTRAGAPTPVATATGAPTPTPEAKPVQQPKTPASKRDFQAEEQQATSLSAGQAGDHASPSPLLDSAQVDPWPATWLQAPTISIGPAVRVAGTSYRQDALEVVAGGRNFAGTRRRLLTATLVREPDNPHDSNAVRIDVGGVHVGYLPRDGAPGFHAIIQRLTAAGLPSSCRASLTGGWDEGPGNRGSIGMDILTGSRPTRWRGGGAFLPEKPWHEEHVVTLHPGDTPLSGLPTRSVVSLRGTGRGSIAVLRGDRILGDIPCRPDLAALISRVHNAHLPVTANARVTTDGKLVVMVVDPDAVAAALDRLGSCDLRAVRMNAPLTGRWLCKRCGRIWHDSRRPQVRWYNSEDDSSGSPHICPQCWSYAFTHPL